MSICVENDIDRIQNVCYSYKCFTYHNYKDKKTNWEIHIMSMDKNIDFSLYYREQNILDRIVFHSVCNQEAQKLILDILKRIDLYQVRM